MVMKESQEGYKQPTESRDSVLMSKVEAFFHKIDIKTGKNGIKMEYANRNISTLLGKTSETDTSADTYFDKLPESEDGEDAAEILFNSLKISAEENHKLKRGTVVLEDIVKSPHMMKQRKTKQVSVKLIL